MELARSVPTIMTSSTADINSADITDQDEERLRQLTESVHTLDMRSQEQINVSGSTVNILETPSKVLSQSDVNEGNLKGLQENAKHTGLSIANLNKFIAEMKQTAPVVTSTTDIQNIMNITHFEQLMKTFQEAEESEGIRGFDIDRFRRVFGQILGGNLSYDQMTQLFMKIDANSDGSVDWDEFSTYMMMGSLDTSEKKIVFNERDKKSHICKGRDMIKKIDFIPKERKYLTVSRDGHVLLWNTDFIIQKSIQTRDLLYSVAWITDAVFLHEYNKLVTINDDRQLGIFDVLSIKPRCLLVVGTMEHNPISVCFARPHDDESDMILFGDDGGYLNILSFNRRFFVDNASDGDPIIFNPMSSGKTNTAIKGEITFVRRKLNDEWISRVAYYPEMSSFVACSSEKTKSVTIGDLQRKSVRHINISKGIRCFEYCRRPSFLITGGRDKTLRLWNPYVLSKCAGTLTGHNATITNICVSHQDGYIISLSEDKVINLWDTRTLTLVQTILDKTYTRPENIISALYYDPKSKHLLSGTNTLDTWPMTRNGHKGSVHIRSHDAPIVSALYNSSFKLVVSACQNSTVIIWNLSTGERTFNYHKAHNDIEITAMCFDTSGRRLLTGSRDGIVKVWNFNNGAILQILYKDNQEEITDICHVELGPNRYILSTGWDRKVSVFVDNPEKHESKAIRTIRIDGYGTQRGHEDDVQSIAFLPPNKLATAGIDGKIIIWNFNSGHLKLILKDPRLELKAPDEKACEKILFLVDPKVVDAERVDSSVALVSCHADACIRFWDSEEGVLLLEQYIDTEYNITLTAMSYNPVWGILTIGDSRGTVRIFNVKDFRVIPNLHDYSSLCNFKHEFRAHIDYITSVRLVSTTQSIITSGRDCSIRVWTINGLLIGIFGQENNWDILSPSTYLPLPEDLRRENEREVERAKERQQSMNIKKLTNIMDKEGINLAMKPNPEAAALNRDGTVLVNNSSFYKSKLTSKGAVKKWKEKSNALGTANPEEWKITPDLLAKKSNRAFFSFDSSKLRKARQKPTISKTDSAYHNLQYHNIEDVTAPVKPSANATLPVGSMNNHQNGNLANKSNGPNIKPIKRK